MSGYEDDVVFAGDYFPVGLWLGTQTCLVRDDDSPDQGVVDRLVARLTEEGMTPILLGEDLQAAVLSISMSRLQVIAASWTVWSVDEPTARAALAEASF